VTFGVEMNSIPLVKLGGRDRYWYVFSKGRDFGAWLGPVPSPRAEKTDGVEILSAG
jgi:hypothetical protein